MIIAHDYLEVVQIEDSSFCSVQMVGDPVFTIGVSMPVSAHFQRALSSSISDMVFRGVYIQEASVAKLRSGKTVLLFLSM